MTSSDVSPDLFNENSYSSEALTFHLLPLSIQPEKDSYLVGNVQLNRFYQMPEIGVRIIHLLQEGLSFAAVKARLAAEPDGDIDVEAFLDPHIAWSRIHCSAIRRTAAVNADLHNGHH